MRLIKLAAIALALVPVSAFLSPVRAAEVPAVAGSWSGQVQIFGQAASITLSLKPTADGPAGDILWGGKAQCRTTQSYSGVRDNGDAAPTLLLTVTKANGPFCDQLWNGAVELTRANDDQLDAVFLTSKGLSLLTAKLSKRSAAAP